MDKTKQPELESTSRLENLHAVIFTAGFMLTFVAVITGIPELFLISGPCLMVSALLLWLGIRVSLAGLVGQVLRAALGPKRLASMRMRALAWLLIGLALTVWGSVRLARAPAAEVLPLPPHISQALHGGSQALHTVQISKACVAPHARMNTLKHTNSALNGTSRRRRTK